MHRLLTVEQPIHALGVGEWACRKGQRNGAMLADLEQWRVVDLFQTRSPDGFAAGLEDRPAV